MYTEADLLPISAIQHMAFCERQCALIHLEGIWAENRLTADGRIKHKAVDSLGTERRGDLITARGLSIRSLRLGLTGKPDVVEFRRVIGPYATAPPYVRFPDVEGVWLANPVEHKRGKPKIDDCDEVQLCAQAMCIEEMLNTEIPSGDLFYGLPRRRHQVEMTAGLRKRTESLALRLHALFASEKTPPPSCGPQCQNCSLQTSCMPNTVSRSSGVRAFLRRMKSRERE